MGQFTPCVLSQRILLDYAIKVVTQKELEDEIAKVEIESSREKQGTQFENVAFEGDAIFLFITKELQHLQS